MNLKNSTSLHSATLWIIRSRIYVCVKLLSVFATCRNYANTITFWCVLNFHKKIHFNFYLKNGTFTINAKNFEIRLNFQLLVTSDVGKFKASFLWRPLRVWQAEYDAAIKIQHSTPYAGFCGCIKDQYFPALINIAHCWLHV